MKMSDRRFAQRFDVRIPLHYRAWKSLGAEAQAVATNISERGLFFEADREITAGENLQVRLRMPQEVTGLPSAEWRCTGRVVRVQPSGATNAKCGVGLRIDYYEVAQPESGEKAVAAGH
jgi:Tfp pilus assembly protein PilZ